MGNDFMIAPLAEYEKRFGGFEGADFRAWVQPIVQLCDRKRGFGADGVILHGEPQNGQVQCILINSNGTLASFSGNGFACLTSNFSEGQVLNINGKFDVSKSDEGVQISVKQFGSIKDRYFFEHKLGGYDYSLWDVGNEHAVFLKFSNESDCLLFEHPFNSFDKLEEGELESHFKSTKLYPEGINVGLALVGENWIQLKVWERGCGWTEACSSGAIAAFLAANSFRMMSGEVQIRQVGGLSTIYWSVPNRLIKLCLRPRFVGRLEYEVKR